MTSPPDFPPSDPWSGPPSAPPPPLAPPPDVVPPHFASPEPSSVPPFSPVSPPASVPPPDVVAPGPVIVQIGDIGVTSSVVHTPAGDIPLAGSTWQVSDYWHNEQKIPTWAIVAAIVGFCVLTVFSLLFLLVKVTVPRGTVQVTVTNGTRQYVARIPVTDQSQVTYVHQQVNYVRSLAAL
ncbi:MAG TPA: hypothetical protein VGQ92_24375 [Actinoplanes sp.]|nr:hypothetical protein [Actinoplanes sp.]